MLVVLVLVVVLLPPLPPDPAPPDPVLLHVIAVSPMATTAAGNAQISLERGGVRAAPQNGHADSLGLA